MDVEFLKIPFPLFFLSVSVLTTRNILQKETYKQIAAMFSSYLQMEMLKLS